MPSGSSQSVDAIIVGGGLAGILLGLEMDRRGMQPLVVDRPDSSSSSRIAAGVINPVTGRRFALSWMYDVLHPVFSEVYKYWEIQWDTRFFYPKNIFRSVPHNKLVNDLDAKLSDPDFRPYCRQMSAEEVRTANAFVRFSEPGYLMHGYQLDTGIFLDHAIRYLRSRESYVEGLIQGDPADLDAGRFEFPPYASDRLVWANGASIAAHPLFSWVRMNPNKGEVFRLDIPDLTDMDIVKQSAFYIPMSSGKCWVGTYNTWDTSDVFPSIEGLKYLWAKTKVLKSPFTRIEHVTAIRPTVEDRRPVIGCHPQNENLLIFNGFGSKGASLIPYFARMFADHLEHNREILPEADVRRYWNT